MKRVILMTMLCLVLAKMDGSLEYQGSDCKTQGVLVKGNGYIEEEVVMVDRKLSPRKNAYMVADVKNLIDEDYIIVK